MKHYDKTVNLFSIEPSPMVPSLACQREHVRCFHCGEVTVIPVRPEYIDWQTVADQYKAGLQRILNHHAQTMADMELIYGADNPAAVHYRNQLAALVLEIRASLGQPHTGSSTSLFNPPNP